MQVAIWLIEQAHSLSLRREGSRRYHSCVEVAMSGPAHGRYQPTPKIACQHSISTASLQKEASYRVLYSQHSMIFLYFLFSHLSILLLLHYCLLHLLHPAHEMTPATSFMPTRLMSNKAAKYSEFDQAILEDAETERQGSHKAQKQIRCRQFQAISGDIHWLSDWTRRWIKIRSPPLDRAEQSRWTCRRSANPDILY